MQETLARTLDEKERRRVGAMMLTAARGAQASAQRERRDARHHAPVRRRERGAALSRRLVSLLLEMPGRLSFKTAFCAAAAAWGGAMVFFLGCFEILPW